MDDVIVNETPTVLSANQIACLEYNQERLYGEVIQLIPQRQLCWFRPMYLTVLPAIKSNAPQVAEIVVPSHPADCSPTGFASDEAKQLIDLRSGSDLLWPAILFRPAFDTEVLDFWTQLREINAESTDKAANHKYLHAFLRQVWRSHQEKFSSK